MTTLENNIEISFWQLLSATSKIVIPIIQRDYAQGRSDDKTKEIRTRFLGKIINVLSHSETDNQKKTYPLELDFVYGNIENNVFQPLDGQQRLTTLFLLHWYIAHKIKKLSGNKNEFLRFTYETRISSREFCSELVNKGNNLGKGEAISEQIKDSTWFFLSWENDPTIKAMLIMLNDIEKQLVGKNLTELWTKLISKNPPIIFHFKELKDIGLTDDLYIKMNARGKELTDFEHFKALFEKHIDEKEWEAEITSPQHTFSHKIDTIWTDLFWKHRGEDNLVDNEFIKFISGLAINAYAKNQEIYESIEEERKTRERLEGENQKNITDEAVKRERIENRIQALFNNPSDINPEDFPNEISFNYLDKCFDIYSKSNYDLLLPDKLLLWNFCENKKVKINNNTEADNTLFIEFIKGAETTYKQRALFYAQTLFLLKQEDFVAESFFNWMRVVRNIVQNSTINSATTFIGSVGLISEISKGCDYIYKYLAQNPIKSSFASNQIKEEVLKSALILKSSNNKDVIFATEDTNFCKGKIKFQLYCVDFEKIEDSFDSKALSDIQKVISNHLNMDEISNKFRRAMLTIKINDFYTYWGTWSYGTDSYKRCLIKDVLDLKNNFTEGYYKDYLKDLLLQLVDKNLDEIIIEYSCPQEMPNWKCRLIKEPDLLETYCYSHFFGIQNDNTCCYLFIGKKRPSNRKECEKVQ